VDSTLDVCVLSTGKRDDGASGQGDREAQIGEFIYWPHISAAGFSSSDWVLQMDEEREKAVQEEERLRLVSPSAMGDHTIFQYLHEEESPSSLKSEIESTNSRYGIVSR
jgi:hypothetical protein